MTTKERPILFSAPMVRAILAGTKTQTRRVVKPQPNVVHAIYNDASIHTNLISRSGDQRIHCPYGKPDDRLWVRETFFDTAPFKSAPIFLGRGERFAYRADDEFIGCHKWKPSIHMPRRACRILLEVTAVRVEQLHDISDRDALAEGVDRTNTSIPGYAIERYRRLWESINGASSWGANPWVWVVEFRRAEGGK